MVKNMKNIIFIISLISFSVFFVGGEIHFPKIQKIEFEPHNIISGSRERLCEKYSQLFMEALHDSLSCSEDYDTPQKQSEYCISLSRLLTSYSKLRSKYCYDED